MASAREFFRGKSDTQLEELWQKWNNCDPATLARSRTAGNIGGQSASFQVDFTNADMFRALRMEILSRSGLAARLGVRGVNNIAIINNRA